MLMRVSDAPISERNIGLVRVVEQIVEFESGNKKYLAHPTHTSLKSAVNKQGVKLVPWAFARPFTEGEKMYSFKPKPYVPKRR